MANPPYSASVLVIVEGPDGISLDLVHWHDRIVDDPSASEHPKVKGITDSLKKLLPKPDFSAHRHAATRAAAVTQFQGFLNQRYNDTPAS